MLLYRDENIPRLKNNSNKTTNIDRGVNSPKFFEVMFSQELADNNAPRDDVYYLVAHLIRSVSAPNQVLLPLLNNTMLIISLNKVQPSFSTKNIDNIFHIRRFI